MVSPLRKETVNYHSRLIFNILERYVYYIFTEKIGFYLFSSIQENPLIPLPCMASSIELDYDIILRSTWVILLCSWASYSTVEWKCILVKFQVWALITCNIIALSQGTAILLNYTSGGKWFLQCHLSYNIFKSESLS